MRGYTKKMVRDAISGSGGIMFAVAKKLGCKWETAKKYVDKFKLQEEMNYEKEVMLDMAENKLFKNIQDGDNASIFFFLKTQGKERGYIERQDIIFNRNSIVNVRHKTDDED